MTDPSPEKPRRRPRYRGANPRRFHEKYKELQPERYGDEVAKVLAAGKTPAGTHRPIMVREILEILAPVPGEIAVDCTLGYGGHARKLLAAVQPNGRLLAMDADPIELPKTEARLRALGFPEESLVLRNRSFAALPQFLADEGPGGVDVILADLGLSSMQIDDPSRGFTFKDDGPLDMRMNPSKGRSASVLLSTLNAAALSCILSEYADEPCADALAAAIHSLNVRTPITSTHSLADVVSRTCATLSRPADDTIRRVFQALRIAVNDELGALSALLRVLPSLLKPGGRVAILTFHSGEDRLVKSSFKTGLLTGFYSSIASDPIRPSAEERRDNPRSTPAKLRFAVRSPVS